MAAGLTLRHDDGSQYSSDHFQSEIRILGIESSPSFVRSPEGNGCAERFIWTLKEQLLWIQSFDDVEQLRQGLRAWARLYNETWLVQRHGNLTPAQANAQLRQAVRALPDLHARSPCFFNAVRKTLRSTHVCQSLTATALKK